MRILVTGASGFIGGHMVEQLAGMNTYQIIATGRTTTNRFESSPNVVYQAHDLTYSLPELACDICIHAAGLADDKSTSSQLEAANVTATHNLIQALTGCQCLIYISSSSVYDFSDGQPKREEDTSNSASISGYGRSKLLGENTVTQSRIPSVYILRPRAVYGRGDRVLMPRIVQLAKNKRMVVPGPLRSWSSMTHIENLSQAIMKCISKQQSGLHIYNVADLKLYLLNDVFSEIAYLKKGHRNIVHIPLPVVNAIITITGWLGIKTLLTRQSVDYLNQDSILSIDRAMDEINYLPTRHFFNSQSDL